MCFSPLSLASQGRAMPVPQRLFGFEPRGLKFADFGKQWVIIWISLEPQGLFVGGLVLEGEFRVKLPNFGFEQNCWIW